MENKFHTKTSPEIIFDRDSLLINNIFIEIARIAQISIKKMTSMIKYRQ